MSPKLPATPLSHIIPFLCLLVTFSLACEPEAEQVDDGAPPNIVLIVSDDHHWGDHGFMGHVEVRTPHLDQLAAESMVYTRGYTPASVCRPSLATMVTGLYPHQHGITGNDPPGGREARAGMEAIFVPAETVLERLHASGFASFQSGKWWEGDPMRHGFTRAMTHGDVTRGGRHGDDGLTIGREGLQPLFDFVAEARDEPFLVYYAPFLPHTPHNPPDSLLARHMAADRSQEIAKYYAMIEWFDSTVGDLLDYLDRAGLRDNTLVVYVADNGWRQFVGEQRMADMRAKMSPYDAGMRTPIMLRWPGKITPGRDEETLVSTLDLVPTMLSATRVEPAAGLPGLDLRSREALADREMIFGELFAHTAVDITDPTANLKYRYVVRQDGWKLILPYTPNRDVTLMINGAVADWMRFEPELYNVLQDPHETNNVAGEHPKLVDTLHAAIDAWWPVR